MKIIRIAIASLLLTICTCYATTPTGTVLRAVMVDTNGVLFGASTNFASINGLAGTGSLVEVAISLVTVSNTAVLAVSSASVAQATADYSMATGMAAQAMAGSAITSAAVAQASANAAMSTGAAAQAFAVSAMATGVAAQALADSKVSTNNATYLQTITLAANALKSDSYAPNLIVNVSGLGTNKIIVSGANLSGVNGSFYYAGTNVPGVPVPAYSNSSAYYFIYGGGSAWLVVTAAAPYSTYYTGGASVTNAYTGGVTPPVVVYDQISSNTISAEIQSKLSISAVSWKTNLVIAPGGTTNTLIFLGAP